MYLMMFKLSGHTGKWITLDNLSFGQCKKTSNYRLTNVQQKICNKDNIPNIYKNISFCLNQFNVLCRLGTFCLIKRAIRINFSLSPLLTYFFIQSITTLFTRGLCLAFCNRIGEVFFVSLYFQFSPPSKFLWNLVYTLFCSAMFPLNN